MSDTLLTRDEFIARRAPPSEEFVNAVKAKIAAALNAAHPDQHQVDINMYAVGIHRELDYKVQDLLRDWLAEKGWTQVRFSPYNLMWEDSCVRIGVDEYANMEDDDD